MRRRMVGVPKSDTGSGTNTKAPEMSVPTHYTLHKPRAVGIMMKGPPEKTFVMNIKGCHGQGPWDTPGPQQNRFQAVQTCTITHSDAEGPGLKGTELVPFYVPSTLQCCDGCSFRQGHATHHRQGHPVTRQRKMSCKCVGGEHCVTPESEYNLQ